MEEYIYQRSYSLAKRTRRSYVILHYTTVGKLQPDSGVRGAESGRGTCIYYTNTNYLLY